jgi:hypothetical protein
MRAIVKVIKALLAFSFPALLLPMAVNAQLTLFTFDGATETPVGATYNYPAISAGATESVRFRVFNTTTSPVTISTPTVAGAGFSVTAINGTTPYPLAPSNFLEFTVQFTGTIVASYSANLQVNGISALLLATVHLGPIITPPAGCVFSTVVMGASGTCSFSLQNPGAQPLPISLAVTGSSAFQGPQGSQAPLNPSETRPFTITFTPVCGTVSYTGSLVVNGQAFALSGTGQTPQIAPTVTFDSGVFASAQQRALTLTLATAAPCGATGNLNLAFAPSVQNLDQDGSVVFLQGKTLNQTFSVAPNSTVVTIGGQPSATFQTGTTAGTITFTVTGALVAGYQMTPITIPPALITIDTTSASNQISGQLDVEVTGFDNTYSAGAMSFTFFDTTGKQVGSAIAADFTPQFKSYFAAQSSGSAFLMRVSFPVLGTQTLIGTVQVTLTNTAGPVQTGPLTFQ